LAFLLKEHDLSFNQLLDFAFFSVLGEDCQAYIDRHGKAQPAKSCPNFCCGDCMLQYCCSDVFLKFGEERQFQSLLYNAAVPPSVGACERRTRVNSAPGGAAARPARPRGRCAGARGRRGGAL
uniref:Shisa N-terminal domain-containing protein n=1 Tax=Strix occidentalis caurina TaxID=311401 RepID=A0A8D0FMJ5_STROC